MRNQLSLSPAEFQSLDEQLRTFALKGLIPIIYAQRALDLEQTLEYQKRYQNLKHGLVEDSEQKQKLAKDFETKLILLGVVGLKNNLKSDAEPAVSFLREINIKTWLLSGDGPDNTINSARNLRLINQNTIQIYHFIDEREESIVFSIKNIFRKFKTLVKPH